MQVLLAVVEDLYTFAVSMLFSWRADLINVETQLYLPASRSEKASHACSPPLREAIEIETYHGWESVIQDDVSYDVPTQNGGLPQKNTIVYCARAHVRLRTTPDSATDTAITTLEYGDMVMVLEAGPEYAYVAVGNKKGYVPIAVLAQEAASVYPKFVIGAANSARETNTIRLRSVIRDEFSASVTQLPLQAHEYVYYKLLRQGTHIVWPDVRPRTPGSWTRILSLLEDVVISDTPTVGSIMECMLSEDKVEGNDTGKAHLAYVDKVFPDKTIQISEADWPDRGIYNERILAANEWRTLNPSFIMIV